MKLVKGSLAAKKYMANIRSKKKINGNEKELSYNAQNYYKTFVKLYPDHLTIDTTTPSKDINKAVAELEKNNLIVKLNYNKGFADYQLNKNNMKKIGSVKASKEVKKTLKAKKLYMPHGYATAKRKRKIGEVHTDTKSHNVKIDIMSGVNPYIEKIKKGLIIIQNEIDFLNKEIKVTKEILIKKSMFNRKKYLMNELNIGKQLLKKF
jgi:hypothetical protein